jgi:hypothetical protein
VNRWRSMQERLRGPGAGERRQYCGQNNRYLQPRIWRGRVRSLEPLVHRSVLASDHYPLSMNAAFVWRHRGLVRSPCLGHDLDVTVKSLPVKTGFRILDAIA